MRSDFYSLRQFKALPLYDRLRLLYKNAVNLNIGYTTQTFEKDLFAYHDYYIEVVVERYSNVVLEANPFKNIKQLTPFLLQVDIDEITILLSH